MGLRDRIKGKTGPKGPPPKDLWADVATSTYQSATELVHKTVHGKSDEELMEQAAHLGGADNVVRSVLEGMARSLNPRHAEDCTVGFRITVPGEQDVYQAIVVKDRAARVVPGSGVTPDLVQTVTFADFTRMIALELNAVEALFTGRVVLDGNTALAARLPAMFTPEWLES